VRVYLACSSSRRGRGQQCGVPEAQHSGPFFSGLDGTSKRRPWPGRIAPRSLPLSSLRGWVVAHDHFFKMSRSSSAIRSALRSRTNSSRSAVVNPVRPFERSACARLTHSRNAVSVRSRSRAAALTVLPSSSTRRTALALNSSVNWRRARRFAVSAIGLDIVFPFGKMSTKPTMKWLPLSTPLFDGAQSRRPGSQRAVPIDYSRSGAA
jgi:hypothetical protein